MNASLRKQHIDALHKFKRERDAITNNMVLANYTRDNADIVMEANKDGFDWGMLNTLCGEYAIDEVQYIHGLEKLIKDTSHFNEINSYKTFREARIQHGFPIPPYRKVKNKKKIIPVPVTRDVLHDFLHHPSVSMDRPSIDDWALSMCREIAERSTCVRRKAGAVALDEHNRVVSVGYNGVPRGIPHCTEDHKCPGADGRPGDTSECMAIHAEINCIMHAKDSYRIHKMYVTCTPCMKCGLVLANLPNLTSVICSEKYADERGILVLNAAGIDVKVIHNEEEYK